MTAVPIVIVAVVFVLVLLRRRRGRRGAGEGRAAPAALLARRGPGGDTGLVAAREVRERLRGRYFRMVTLVLLAVVAAAIVIPTIHSSSSRSVKAGVVGSLPVAFRHDIVLAAGNAGLALRLVTERDAAQAYGALRSGKITVLIDDRTTVVVKTAVTVTGTTTITRAASAIASVLGVDDAVAAAHLTAAQAAVIAHAKPVPVRSLESTTRSGAARSRSVVGLILVFVMLTQHLTWTLMGVMEEKASRVVEVLLATVRPVQLLGGKVLGIGIVALLQAGLVVAFALVLADAVGSDLSSWHGADGGALDARVARARVRLLLVGVCRRRFDGGPPGAGAEPRPAAQRAHHRRYVVGLTNAGPGNPSLLLDVFAYLPPTAPIAMPVLVAHGQTTWWEFVSPRLLSVACTIGVARVAAGVYRTAVLRTGRRVTLKELLASAR